jgi:hypothetical protein
MGESGQVCARFFPWAQDNGPLILGTHDIWVDFGITCYVLVMFYSRQEYNKRGKGEPLQRRLLKSPYLVPLASIPALE